ncbi:MAG: glycoside hydrolase family 16 protein [Prevotellaceae bacterium]|nr:glycoside hydrolase family 16 protein [Prevotellaceae bacterium]
MKRSYLFLLIALFSLQVCGQKPFSKLVFEENFDGEGLPDERYWSYEEGYVRNKEKQYYSVNRLENCYQKDGFLHIVILNDSALIKGKKRPVTSASIYTKGKQEWKYCNVEVRAKLPSCLGTWPAIWMMPVKDVYGKWPRSGEIDIMEHVGYEPENVHYAIHSEKYNHVKGNQRNHTHPCPDSYTSFHVYGLEWTENKITWRLDGIEQFSVEKTEDSPEAWPFDQPFYLILNAAFGGGWGGYKGIDISQLPQKFSIDYVRVYQ